MKNTFKVKLNKIISIKDFANMASGFESDIDIISGRYTGDAKSIMGLFSYDLSKPVDIVIHSDDEEELKRFAEAIKPYEVKE